MSMYSDINDDNVSYGCCGNILLAISLFLVIVTFPIALCFSIKVLNSATYNLSVILTRVFQSWWWLSIVHVIGKCFCFTVGLKTNYYCLLNRLSATVKWLRVKTASDLFSVLNFFCKNKFWNPTYISTKLEFKFRKCSKLVFQQLNKILTKHNPVHFVDYIIIFWSMKLLAHFGNFCLCTLTSFRHMSCTLMSGFEDVNTKHQIQNF